VELDRNAIERRDFPVTRRGYDPAEVDAHLAQIAAAVEELRGASTAGNAAQRVRGILEAAERSAAEIEAGAREEAERGRTQAHVQAEESLRRAGEAESLLEQAGDELERLRGALAKLRATLEAPPPPPPQAAEPGPPPRAAPEGEADMEEPADEPLEPAAEEEGEAATAHAELPEADDPVDEAQVSPAEAAYDAAPSAGGKRSAKQGNGAEGARLIALNMALNGTPREETERYLEENFELGDPGALLDEVYTDG
jgi:DivIVA domain-containing protein